MIGAMAENLFIRLDQHAVDASSEVEWMLLDEISGVARGQGKEPLSAVAATMEESDWSGRVIALVPGEDVLVTSAAVPTRNQHQMLQALPYVLEEQIATDVEEMHFAIGERLSRGDIVVATVARAAITKWVKLLRDAKLAPHVMVPDSLCVPLEGDGAAILIEGKRALVRVSPMQGLAVERDLLGTLLQLDENGGAQSVGSERRVVLLVDRSEVDELELEITQWQAELDGRLDRVVSDYAPFETLCRNYSARLPNLLQGEFRAQKTDHESQLGWKLVAAVAGVCLLVQFTLMAGKGVYLSLESDRLQREALALYADVFPDDRNVRDIRRRWQAHLSGAGQATQEEGFLPMVREAAKSLAGSGIQVDNINFNEQRGDLILQVRAGSSDQLVAYSQRLSQVGLAAEIGAINQGDVGVNGSVRISAAKGG